MSYTNVFGGEPQNPSQISLNTLALTSDVDLFWPWSGQPTDDVAAKLMRVSADIAGRDVLMPDAMQASNGEASIFINTGANSFNVQDSTDANITSVAAGQAKYVYLISNATSAGVWGVFTFGAGSSGADASALAGAGLLAIANTLNEQISVTDISSTGFNLTSASRALLYNWTGGAGAFTTADPSTLGTGWFAGVKNSGSGALTITPAAGTIDGAASKTLNPGDSCFIVRNGGNLVTIGFGQAVAFTFDYISINVAGTGNFTLNSSQQNRISYRFTGLLAGNRHIIVPATVQQYWVTNATTGAFTLDVGVAAQPTPVAVTQGDAKILYCNGTEVVDAVTTSGGISTPISIANGGTGATTASGARTNLGATATGDALYTAVSDTAARATLGLGTMAVQNAATVAITGGTATGLTALQAISTDAGANAAPTIEGFRNSASPAANDVLMQLMFSGNDSGGNSTIYTDLLGRIVDPTNGSEDGLLAIRTIIAGAIAIRLNVGAGLYSTNASGGDKGVDTANFLSLFLNGIKAIPDTPGASGTVLTSTGAASAPTWQASTGIPSGASMEYWGTTSPTGWVMLDGKTIGSATSGGTERANADCQTLFELLWNSTANAQCPVSGGRGANSAADWAANKTITLPDARGRTIAGKDDMGGTSANRLTGLSGGVDGDILANSGGSQSHTLTIAELASHTHPTATSDGLNNSTTGTADVADNTNTITDPTGGDQPHNNVQPTLIANIIIKL